MPKITGIVESLKVDSQELGGNLDFQGSGPISVSSTDSSITISIDRSAMSMEYHYVGSDTPGTGDNTLEDGQMRLWQDTNTGETKLLARINTSYYTTPFLDGTVDGGSF